MLLQAKQGIASRFRTKRKGRLGHRFLSKRRVDAEKEDVRASGRIADGLIRDRDAPLVFDAAAADEVEWREAVYADQFGKELHIGQAEPCGTYNELVLTLPWRSFRTCFGSG